MKRLLCVLILMCLPGLVLAAQEPESLAIVKQGIEKYHDSGQYLQAIATQVAKGKRFLEKRIAENNASPNKKRLAMLLDIDETSLSNYPDMVKEGFGGDLDLLDRLEAKAHDPAIQPILSLYQYAEKNGVAVFFVTGRKEWLRKSTRVNLYRMGYSSWRHLYMKPNKAHFNQARFYKTPIRCAIEKAGYDVVLNIGDQYSDLQGGCADMAIKLPNPFYFIG